MTRYVAGVILGARVDELNALVKRGGSPTPSELLEAVLTGAINQPVLFAVVMQMWSESITDPALGEVVQGLLGQMRAAMRDAVTPWARQQTPSEEQATQLADRTSFILVALAQGFITHTAMQGPLSPAEYISGLRHLERP
ncbi:hypothetical protein G7067_09885 [Leucobacter insecticola]|uniref:BetI-type transcriptional repressor C-terminal domain-containing protein n=1 Tax=Leucobacter insecticola TaxID=2714934 RepID=A0A6G8FKP0_9MICO|nr:TetR family transcriptional regulator C-terminal domain-containing protein [Leucobacter insecticola]QIM16642.1 hypothetical protein G7067_09885 [Leucobacter insecticola]